MEKISGDMENQLYHSGIDMDKIVDRAIHAGEAFKQLDQKKTDEITRAVFEAGYKNRHLLAKLAWEETKLGRWEDKVIKNTIATLYVYQDIKDAKTVDVIAEDRERDIVEIAEPVGPILALTPITNPTSTVLFKILISMKSRNPIIIKPHGSARKCSVEAARLTYDAALQAGAPENCIQWIKTATRDEVLSLMAHKEIAMILATGSIELVRAASRSGNPTIGVGPGNVPVYIGRTADIPFAVKQIIISKTFDYGSVCSSEQAIVTNRFNADAVKRAFKEQRAHFLSKEEIRRLEPVAFDSDKMVMRVEVIGQPAAKIAEMAGIKVPSDTTVLIAPLEEVGITSPLSLEILAPILAFYVADDFEQAIELCRQINNHGGLGHTASIFSKEEDKIAHFASVMNAGRILVNTPASQGAMGGTYNKLKPSLMLPCGPSCKNITADNISVEHLLSIRRIARLKMCAESHERFVDDCLDAERDLNGM